MSEVLLNMADYIRINLKCESTGRLEVGRTLIKAKSHPDMKHGMWLPWLQTEFGISVRTAQNYMQAAEGADVIQSVTGLKYETVSHLPAKKLRAVATAINDPTNTIEIDLESDKSPLDQIIEAAMPATKPAAVPASLNGYVKSASKAALAAVALLDKQLMPGDFAKFKKLFDTAGPSAFSVALFMPHTSEAA